MLDLLDTGIQGIVKRYNSGSPALQGLMLHRSPKYKILNILDIGIQGIMERYSSGSPASQGLMLQRLPENEILGVVSIAGAHDCIRWSQSQLHVLAGKSHNRSCRL